MLHENTVLAIARQTGQPISTIQRHVTELIQASHWDHVIEADHLDDAHTQLRPDAADAIRTRYGIHQHDRADA